MRLGLWFEPEMVSEDSNLYRAHPDWCLSVRDAAVPAGATSSCSTTLR